MVYELAFPWSEIVGLRPLAGERMQFTVAASDDDGKGIKGFLERSVLLELGSDTGPGTGQKTPPRSEHGRSSGHLFVARHNPLRLSGIHGAGE